MARLSERFKGNMYRDQKIMAAIRLLETNVQQLDHAYERYIYGMNDLKSIKDLLDEIEDLRTKLGLGNESKKIRGD